MSHGLSLACRAAILWSLLALPPAIARADDVTPDAKTTAENNGSFTAWLSGSLGNAQPVPLSVLAARLGLALVGGCGVAAVYAWTQSRDRTVTLSFMSTLVMLAVLMAVVTQVVGDNFALAFSLVGALSIVRFRTVVEDTRDTAFVIFAVVIGMSLGAGFLAVAVAGLIAGCLAALVMQPRRRAVTTGAAEWTLTVRLGAGQNPQSVLAGPLGAHCEDVRLFETGTTRQGAALEVRYRVRLRAGSDATALVAEINRIEGIQGVELRGRD